MTTLLRQLSDARITQNQLKTQLKTVDDEIIQLQENIEALNQIEAQINNSSENKEYHLNLLEEAKNGDYEALDNLFVNFGYKTILQDWNKKN